MTQIHLQDWQATLVKHMGALSRSTDPMVEIGLLLCEFSDYMQAEYCAKAYPLGAGYPRCSRSGLRSA
jgi:hypothetical protein